MVVRPASSQSNVKVSEQEMDVIMTDPFKYVSDHVKRKIRNLEKRKEKLDGYKAKLAKGDKLNADQLDAIAKYGEVIGMITFASEIVNHLTGLENPVKKERKKRNRREQIKQQQDRMDLMTRAIETLTLMHLPEAHEEPTVSPLRDQTLFSPSPGTHLADCSADTAKLLVGIFDEEKAETEVFSTEDGPVTYKQVRDTLETIRPKYNPVPEYDDQTTPDETIDENVDNDAEENGHEQIPEDETYENGGDTEVSSPVVVNEDEISQIDDEYVEVTKEEINEEADVIATEQVEPVLDFQQPSLENIEMPPVQTPLEFTNKKLYCEEEQIQEILVDVSSGFNFLAPADEPVEEPQPDKQQGISFGFDYNSTVQGYAEEQVPVSEPVAQHSQAQVHAQHQLQQQQQQRARQEQLQSQQAPPPHHQPQQQHIQQQREQQQHHHHHLQQQQAPQENKFSNEAYVQAPAKTPSQRQQPQRQAVPPPQQHQHQYQQRPSPEQQQMPNEELKDNLTWQQREVAAQKNYRGGSAGGNYSYKNSQRYQRSFQGGNRVNGEGDGHNRQRVNGGAPRGGPGQYRRGAPQKQ